MVNTELPSQIFHLTIYCLQELGSTIETTIKMWTGDRTWANWRKSSPQWHEWGEQYTQEVVSRLAPNNNVPIWPCILSEATQRFFLRSELAHTRPQTQEALARPGRCAGRLCSRVMCQCCPGPGSPSRLSRPSSRCPGHSRGSRQGGQAACGGPGTIRRPPKKTPSARQWQWQHQVQASERAPDPAQWEAAASGHHWEGWQGCPARVWLGLFWL